MGGGSGWVGGAGVTRVCEDQGGCEQRIEVFMKIKKNNIFFWGGGGSGGRVWGSGWV